MDRVQAGPWITLREMKGWHKVARRKHPSLLNHRWGRVFLSVPVYYVKAEPLCYTLQASGLEYIRRNQDAQPSYLFSELKTISHKGAGKGKP